MIVFVKAIILSLFLWHSWILYHNHRYEHEVNASTLTIVVASFVTLLALFGFLGV